MKKIDRNIRQIKKVQEEIDHRTKVENEAVMLISKCKFKEAMELLDTIS